MVARLTCSNDVQVELLRSLQPPLDDQVIPDERSLDVACAWVSLVTSTVTSPGALPSKTGSCSLSADAWAVAVASTMAKAATANANSERSRAVLIDRYLPDAGDYSG